MLCALRRTVVGENFELWSILGCLNGGGQLRAGEGETAKELLTRLQDVYKQPASRDPRHSDFIATLYTDWLGGEDSDKARAMLHTSYKEVEKMTNALTIKW